MGMSVGGGRGPKAEMNVTPMIDVLLVLIIIFLVITPSVPKGLSTLVPQESSQATPVAEPSEIVVSVHRNGVYQLNQEQLDFSTLQVRLANLFKNGANQVIFVRGDKDLDFQEVAQVIDMARGSGVVRVALMTN